MSNVEVIKGKSKGTKYVCYTGIGTNKTGTHTEKEFLKVMKKNKNNFNVKPPKNIKTSDQWVKWSGAEKGKCKTEKKPLTDKQIKKLCKKSCKKGRKELIKSFKDFDKALSIKDAGKSNKVALKIYDENCMKTCVDVHKNPEKATDAAYRLLKAGGYKSEMRKAHMGSSRRRSKCKRKYDPKTISRLIKQNPKKYPTNKEDNYWKQNQVWVRKNRKLVSDDKKQIKQCMKKRKEKHKESVRKVNKKFKAESKKAKAELKKNCCKCHYVRTKKGSLRKVRGPWTHCSYDMANCCKDKKTIVEEKGGGKKTFKSEQRKENKEYYQSVKKCRKMKKDKSGKQKKCYRKVNKVRTKTLNRFQKEYPEEWSKFINKSSGMGGSHAKTRLEGSWMGGHRRHCVKVTGSCDYHLKCKDDKSKKWEYMKYKEKYKPDHCKKTKKKKSKRR